MRACCIRKYAGDALYQRRCVNLTSLRSAESEQQVSCRKGGGQGGEADARYTVTPSFRLSSPSVRGISCFWLGERGSARMWRETQDESPPSPISFLRPHSADGTKCAPELTTAEVAIGILVHQSVSEPSPGHRYPVVDLSCDVCTKTRPFTEESYFASHQYTSQTLLYQAPHHSKQHPRPLLIRMIVTTGVQAQSLQRTILESLR